MRRFTFGDGPEDGEPEEAGFQAAFERMQRAGWVGPVIRVAGGELTPSFTPLGRRRILEIARAIEELDNVMPGVNTRGDAVARMSGTDFAFTYALVRVYARTLEP